VLGADVQHLTRGKREMTFAFSLPEVQFLGKGYVFRGQGQNSTTAAVDLAKKVFELALADRSWRIVERAGLTRAQFERWFDYRKVDLVVMEACGPAHYG